MSINRINNQPYINAYNSNVNKTVEPIRKNNNVDRVEISDFARRLQDVSANKEIDNSKRVQEIKTAVENGTYNIDAKLTARSILQAMKVSKF